MGNDILPPLLVSFKVSLAAVLLVSPFAVFLGWWFARKKDGSRTWLPEILMMTPMMVSPVVVGYLVLEIFRPSGFVGSLAVRAGIEMVFDPKGQVLALALIGLPLYAQAVRIDLASVDPKLEWISRSMGNGVCKTFFKVHLPLCKRGMATGMSLCFIRSMGEFGASNVIGGGIVGETETAPVALYKSLNTPGMENRAFLLTLVSIALTVATLFGMRMLSRKFGKLK